MNGTTRRSFLRTTTLAGTGIVGAHMLGRTRPVYGKTSKEVVAVFSGGTWQAAARKAWFEPFERETGIRVIDVAPMDYGKLATMVEAGNVEWDVLDINSSFISVGIGKNLLERLDFGVIDTDGLPKEVVTDYTVPLTAWATLLAYSTKRFNGPRRPSAWADFWDVKAFPGVRAMRRISYKTLEFALMADGVRPEKIYPIDVDRAFKSLDRIKPHVKVWWTQGAQPIQLLTDGEVDMSNAWTARLISARREGAPLDFVWNQGIYTLGHVGVAKGAPNRENAMRLVAYITSPAAQARLVDHIPSAPANVKAYQHIKPDMARILVTAPENAALQLRLDDWWWSENFERVEKRFQEWLLS